MTVLTICAVLSAVAIGAFIYLAILNAGSDKILKPAIQITAALVAAIAFFSLDLLSADDNDDAETNILALYHKDGEPFPFHDPLSSIDSEFGRGFSDLAWIPRHYPPVKDKTGALTQSIDIIAHQDLAMTILQWLAKRNSVHWDCNHYWFQGIGSGGGSTSAKSDAEKRVADLNLGDVARKLSSRFDSAALQAKFPKGTTLTVETSDRLTSLAFESPDYKLVFRIATTGGGKVGATRLGEYLRNPIHDTNDWQTVRANVRINATYKRTRKWSTRTSKISGWVSEMLTDFQRDFAWDQLRPDLEEALTTLKWTQKYVTPGSVTKQSK